MPIPTVSESVRCNHPAWKRALRARDGVALEVGDRVHAIRTLIYSGFYRDAEVALDSWESCRGDELWWRLLLRALVERAQATSEHHHKVLESALASGKPKAPNLGFFCANAIASWRTRLTSDLARGWSSIVVARGALERVLLDSSQAAEIGRLARSSIERFEALMLHRTGEREAAREALALSLANLDKEQSPSFETLELSRRILGVLAVISLEAGEYALAAQAAERAVKIDGSCPQASVIAGEAALMAGDLKTARRHFLRACQTGPVERPFSTLRAAQAAGRVHLEDFYDLYTISFPRVQGLLRRAVKEVSVACFDNSEWIRQRACESGSPALPLPVEYLDSIVAEAPGRCSREAIEATEVHSRLGMFWDLERPIDIARAPVYAHAPLLAWDAVTENADPFYVSLYPQHCFRGPFRYELLAGAVNDYSWSADDVYGGSLESLQESSARVKSVFERRERIRCGRKDARERMLLARLLGYLGFRQDALSLVPEGLEPDRLDADWAHHAYTRLFLQHLALETRGVPDSAELIWSRIERSPETLRVRLQLCVNAGVQYARDLRDQQAALVWQERAAALLEQIRNSDRFSAFEIDLLSSRYFRFASFIPYLGLEIQELERATAGSLQHARDAKPNSERETLLRRDNLHAALESAARVSAFLGRDNEALELVETAGLSADPYDPRLWTQVGEYRERLGLLEEAYSAYVWAAVCGPPYRMIAWHRASHVACELGRFEEAVNCSLRSLRSYPLGLEPLMDLFRVGRVIGDVRLVAWARSMLERVRHASATLPVNRARIGEVLRDSSRPGYVG
ncbi:MAG: tetratricopeptide repeat protein [Planctomycetota bacterium]